MASASSPWNLGAPSAVSGPDRHISRSQSLPAMDSDEMAMESDESGGSVCVSEDKLGNDARLSTPPILRNGNDARFSTPPKLTFRNASANRSRWISASGMA